MFAFSTLCSVTYNPYKYGWNTGDQLLAYRKPSIYGIHNLYLCTGAMVASLLRVLTVQGTRPCDGDPHQPCLVLS